MKTLAIMGAAIASLGILAVTSVESSAAPGHGHGMRSGSGHGMAFRSGGFNRQMMGHRQFGSHRTFTAHRTFGHGSRGFLGNDVLSRRTGKQVMCFRAPCNINPHHGWPHGRPWWKHHHHHHLHVWNSYRPYYSGGYYRQAYRPVQQVYTPPRVRVAAPAPSCWQQVRAPDNTMQWQYVCPVPQQAAAPQPATYTPPQQQYTPQQQFAPQQSYQPQQAAPQQQYAPQQQFAPQQQTAPQQSYQPQQQGQPSWTQQPSS
jgi:hypothetical protein